MRAYSGVALSAVFAMLIGCSGSGTAVQAPKEAPAPEQAKITQFYTTSPQVARGDTALVCYGVENASAVWLDPGHRELSAALSRCVEVTPTENTTYKLSAQSPGGQTVTKELAVTVGAAHVKITNVTVSAVDVKAGDLVNVCYTAENASSVTIEPIGYSGPAGKGCASQQPQKTTTYVVTATGPGGEKDSEKVTVKVR
jgi:hypothetical protein